MQQNHEHLYVLLIKQQYSHEMFTLMHGRTILVWQTVCISKLYLTIPSPELNSNLPKWNVSGPLPPYLVVSIMYSFTSPACSVEKLYIHLCVKFNDIGVTKSEPFPCWLKSEEFQFPYCAKSAKTHQAIVLQTWRWAHMKKKLMQITAKYGSYSSLEKQVQNSRSNFLG
jgi:hypothetical protein